MGRHVQQRLRQAFHRHHLRRKPRAGDRLRDRRLPAGPGPRRRTFPRTTWSGAPPARSRYHLAAARGGRGGDPLRACTKGSTTGTPIALLIRNTDQRSKDYGDIAQNLPPRPRRLHLLAEVRHPRPARRRAFLGARDHHARGGRGDRQEMAGRAPWRACSRLPGAAGRADAGRFRLGRGGAEPVLLARARHRCRRWKPTWTRCASRAIRSVRASTWWPRACRRAGASRSTASSMPTSPRR